MVYDFICSLGLSVSSSSASQLHWVLFSGHQFFGAGASENCLNQFSRKYEVRAVGSIKTLNLGF
ncbi:hypothetical protein [Vibrio parahaemolyticus]|uniref:hypothetical protein n=1 Tax=Vibrio parahaemolyticus TaxID=670 RepID=UPI0010E632B9|nr:hypothetical protein [Vibrio parahaemolyticus]MCX8925859.1 hypothetical protein [Vibrio parahaemolyticus]TBT62256.1 hypothetical protein D5E73_23740 [Vibrio parahaemolyticus]TBT71357.1 hypothetical protein D5E72_23995 [Vibrio parahaemolyticus]TNY67160.1 hypothetical protein CGK63_23495 [Vibrio parahaemolyticus]TOK95258.1 hypothetical protein CGI06_23480 [Vibrio parahaemolyticus]